MVWSSLAHLNHVTSKLHGVDDRTTPDTGATVADFVVRAPRSGLKLDMLV